MYSEAKPIVPSWIVRLIRIIKLYKAIYEARQLQKKKEAGCELQIITLTAFGLE